MEIDNLYSGFKLLEKVFIEEEDSTALIFEHLKTKARLLKLLNKENNKVFGIGFKTPPHNSTGVAHILEHSVLNGSKKYTTREPFMDLLKSSLQTFLNAMTFSDKTIYPVASRNTKDFHNLMDVYLDSVFNPKIYDTKEIFMQEGWHYDLENRDDEIKYKGVVYNEMKGAMSSPEDQVMEEIMKYQYPDTIYSNNSGGDPYCIPDLSYEEFLDFHRNLYHPSNSYIFLYGNGDTKKELSHIEEFLKDYDYLEVNSNIEEQTPFKSPRIKESLYSISKDEKIENKTYLSYSVCLGKTTDFENALMNEVLNEIFVESEASPLKKELLEKGICEDIFASYSDGLYQTFSIVAKNSNPEKMEEFREIVDNTFISAVKDGIDSKLLSASLNKIEFALREKQDHSAKGVLSFITAFHTWLYDESPLIALQYEKPLAQLKAKLQNGYFNEYINRNIVENNFKLYLTVKPEPGLYEKRDLELKENLKNLKDNLSEIQIDNILKENKKLKSFQTRIDTQEDKDTIPKLQIEDINTKIERINLVENNFSDNKVLFLEENTNGIDYIKIIFNCDFIGFKDLPYLSLLSSILGNLDTKNYDYSSLSNEIFLNSGGINFSLNLYSDYYTEELYPKFSMNAKCLSDKVKETVGLMEELSLNTVFENKSRIKDIIMQLKSRIEMSIFDSGHLSTMNRTLSNIKSKYKYNEISKGFDYYFFLQNLSDNFETEYANLKSKLEEIYRKIFRKDDTILSLTMDEKNYEKALIFIKPLLDKYPSFDFEKADYSINKEEFSEAISSSASVQYISKGADLKDLGLGYDGTLSVLSNILSMDYLHNNIRAIGGAYGAGIKFYSDGSLATYSYRDPNLKNTIDIYEKIGEFLDSLQISKEELDNSIIGTMSVFDPVLTTKIKSEIALNRYFSKVKYEDLNRALNEALDTDLQKLKSYSVALKNAMSLNYLTVLGNEKIISENKSLFNKITKLKN